MLCHLQDHLYPTRLLGFPQVFISYSSVGSWWELSSTQNIATILIAEYTVSNGSDRGNALAHLSPAVTASFLIGLSIGGILYRVNDKLPVVAAMLIFSLNIGICYTALPTEMSLAPAQTSDARSDIWSSITSFAKKPEEYATLHFWRITLVCATKLLVLFVISSMSSQHVINYYQDKFELETYQLGFLQSFSMSCRMFFQIFVVGRISSLLDNHVHVMLFGFIGLSVASFIERITSSFRVFVVVSLIPQILCTTVIETASRSWLISMVSIKQLSVLLGLLNVAVSAVGVVSPLFGSYVFLNGGGAEQKGLIAAAYYAATVIVLIVVAATERVLKEESTSRTTTVTGKMHVD